MVASKSTTPAESPTSASVMPAASAPAANKSSSFPNSSTPRMAPAAPVSSFDLPTIQLLSQPPTTTTTAPINANPAFAPSAHIPLKFVFVKEPASTISKPATTSLPTATAADAAKQTSPLFMFSAATPRSSPLGASSPQKFPFDQPTSASVSGSGGLWKRPSPKEQTLRGPDFHASWHPSQMLSFGALSGPSAFATALSSGGDAKKVDAPLSIFGAADATKKDGSKVGASAPAVFSDSGFVGVSNNIFEKSSALQLSGDASTSTSTPKSIFNNDMSSNVFSITPAVFGSAQPGAFAFCNGQPSLQIA
ncbi:hypothetical protein F4604DRAFT_1912818 [Suillus subluteus]|nr:hypothetical protein F4604DRAFT_1912818 [Suillus subluteus]